jgi:hypothetical protein
MRTACFFAVVSSSLRHVQCARLLILAIILNLFSADDPPASKAWSKQLQPVCVAQNATGQYDKDDEQNRPAATTHQTATSKAKGSLQPIE